MKLLKKKKSHPIHNLRDDVFSVFDDFIDDWEMPALFPKAFNQDNFTPVVNFKEGENNYTLTAELPGLTQDDVKLTIKGHLLTISGEKKEEKEEKEENYYHKESSYGSFSRSMELPTEVDLDQVEAKFDHGVLKVALPKTIQAKEKVKNISIHS